MKMYLSLYFFAALSLLLSQCRVNSNAYLMNVNKDGVILDAHDSLAFFTEGKAVKGKEEYQSKYRDAIFYFASAENQSLFAQNPARYSPQFGGWCAYAVSAGHLSPIDIKFFKIQDSRLIFQHNLKAWNLFEKDAKTNLRKADTNWPRLLTKHKEGS